MSSTYGQGTYGSGTYGGTSVPPEDVGKHIGTPFVKLLASTQLKRLPVGAVSLLASPQLVNLTNAGVRRVVSRDIRNARRG